MSADYSGIPELHIGSLRTRFPLVQGGMGVGISRSSLASAVAREGGIGVIAAVGLGETDSDKTKNPMNSTCRVLKQEIETAKKNTDGVIGVNIMSVLTDSEKLIEASVESGADILFLGAGLPHIPDSVLEKIEEIKTKFAVIVSSARAMRLVFRSWLKKYSILPDAVVVEGPKAGGHLGFRPDQINDPECALENLIPPVVEEADEMYALHGKKIPVIAAGGIYTGEDIFRMLKLGASAVQMGTRFAATVESDASDEFKRAYLNCRQEDICIIKSPVGLPGRAIFNPFLASAAEGLKTPFKCLYKCLSTCNPNEAPYCIAKALVNALRGNLENGFAFAGANAWKVDSIVSVKELITELMDDLSRCLREKPKEVFA